MLEVVIDKKNIENCKKEVKEFLKGNSFHEVGGYLIGTYDGNMQVELFFLDERAESTSTRIKLNSDTFLEVEKLLDKNNFQYIGTWHVHPGRGSPVKSEIDESTLFLERLVLETDNPEQYNCPRIHIIFNQDFSKIKCYSMQVKLDYEIIEVETISESNIELDSIDIIKDKLNVLEYSPEKIEIDEMDEIYNKLVEIRDIIDSTLDSIESLIIFEEFNEAFYDNTEVIENIILKNIRNNENIGILAINDKKSVIELPYRPANINPSDLNLELFGFWKYFPYNRIDPQFEEIFLLNFFLKIENEYNNQFFYFRCNKELRVEPYILRFSSYNGLDFIEIEIKILESENED